jgi:hypothetical protein
VSREQREGKRESTNLLGRQRGGKELLDEVGFGRFLVGEIFTLGGEVLLSRLGLIVGEWHWSGKADRWIQGRVNENIEKERLDARMTEG